MTGARAFTLGLCFRKDLVNAHLRARGIAVPDWAVARAGEPLAWTPLPRHREARGRRRVPRHRRRLGRARSPDELEAARERGHKTWERLLVQRFVDGREINVAVVGERVLPHSEIELDAAGRVCPAS